MKAATAEYLKERRVEPSMGEERFIRLGEVLATCGKSRSSVYAGIKEGTFPAPVKLQGRSSAWLRSEVLRWMQTCIEASRPANTASSIIDNSADVSCLVSCDHIPRRSMALFRAKAVLDELIGGLPPRSPHRLQHIA